MPHVNITVNQRAYTVACDEGEEDHLRKLGAHVDSKVRELLESVGQVGDGRLLLMAALLVADDYFDAMAELEGRAGQSGHVTGPRNNGSESPGAAESRATAALEAAAKRVEDIAARLAQA